MSKYLYKLLSLIKADKDVAVMTQMNLNYMQISKLISDSIEADLLAVTDTQIILTEKGEATLKDKLKQNIEPSLSKLIIPKIEERIKALGEKEIYLPKKNIKDQLQ